MPYELIPMACAAGCAAVFAAWAIRTGSSTRDVTGSSLVFFAALTLAGSMALHSGEIFYNAIYGIDVGMSKRAPGAPHANVLGFVYDFRFYSLQLFGGTLIFWGLRLAAASIGIVKGSREGFRAAAGRAWKNILYISLLVTPLIPMQIFAVATAALMGIASVGLILTSRRKLGHASYSFAQPAEPSGLARTTV